MRDDSCSIRPAAAPEDIEWAFQHGTPSIVVHIPDGEGNYSVVMLDQYAPEGHYEREHIRALLRIAERVMADTEPTNPNAGGAR